MAVDHASAPPASELVDELAGELRGEGLVVMPHLLDGDLVDELRVSVLESLDGYVEAAGPNRGVQRHQMYVPFASPFDDPRLWADPTVLAVCERILGADFECIYYGTDTPFPGSAHQPAHQDGGPLFPDWEPRPPTYALTMNVALVDVDEENGPLEWFSGIDRPDDDAAPHRCTGPAGTVLLRDTRTWHRGSPNLGSAPRPMLALMYARSWYDFPLHRPAMHRDTYEHLPEPGGALFRRADIDPPLRRDGDERRLGPYDD